MERKALFWDFDGTLVQPHDTFFVALQEALSIVGCDAAAEDIRGALSSALSWLNPQVLYPDECGISWWTRLFRQLAPLYRQYGITCPKAVNEAFRAYILERPHYTLYDDVHTVLQHFQSAGYRNYILSNNYPELPQAVERLGLSRYFSGYTVSALIGYEKPRPEIFRYAMEMAGMPETCYMMGDNPVADIGGASQNGIPAIWVHPATNDPCPSAYRICTSLTELLDIIP